MKKKKWLGLESQLENFRRRLNPFRLCTFGSCISKTNFPLSGSNEKIVRKLLHAAVEHKDTWRMLTTSLETRLTTSDILPGEVFNHLRCYEERLQKIEAPHLPQKSLHFPPAKTTTPRAKVKKIWL
jgi:hypothetical protein